MTTVKFEDLVRNLDGKVFIPLFSGTENAYEAGMAYGEAGWYLVPIKSGSKNPGSVLGKEWPTKSSRDPKVLSEWFRRSDYGIALHTGRSNCCVLDVDNHNRLTPLLQGEIARKSPPFQSTRNNDNMRGHYAFYLEAAENYSTSNGGLGTEWGEVRTSNSVIVAYPTIHEEKHLGGRYLWTTSGILPELPLSIKRSLKSNFGTAVELIELAEIQTWLSQHNGNLNPQLLQMRIEDSLRFFRTGSRHNACLQLVLIGLKDSAVGHYPANLLVESALAVFLDFKPESEWTPKDEFVSIVRWASSIVKSMSKQELAQHLLMSQAYASPGIGAWIGGDKPWS